MNKSKGKKLVTVSIIFCTICVAIKIFYIQEQIYNFSVDEPAYFYNSSSNLQPLSARITGRRIFHVKPLVIWATEWHMTPAKDLKILLEPFGVKVLDYNMDPWRCGWHDCSLQNRVKVINKNNILDIPPPIPSQFYEHYKNDTEMQSVDVVFCGYPVGACELYVKMNKGVIALASTRYDVGRYTPERWNALNQNLINYSKKPQNIIGGNNLYDAEFIKYYTGIKTRHVQSICDYTNATYTLKHNKTYLVLRRRDRGFNKVFFDELAAECKLINCTTKFVLLGGYSYEEVAAHAGIIHVPYQVSVMSIFEQYRMNIPMFSPTLDLFSAWHAKHYIMPERTFDGAWKGARPEKSIIPPHPSQAAVPDPKNEFKIESLKYWFNFSDFYQEKIMPHGRYFNSVKHLVRMLEDIKPTELWNISAKMQLHNIQMKKDMLTQWRQILIDFAKNSQNKPH